MVEQNARRALALARPRLRARRRPQRDTRATGSDLLHDPQVAELYLGGSASTASSSTSTSTPWRDEPGDEVGRVRRVDAGERLAVRAHGALPVAAGRE